MEEYVSESSFMEDVCNRFGLSEGDYYFSLKELGIEVSDMQEFADEKYNERQIDKSAISYIHEENTISSVYATLFV